MISLIAFFCHALSESGLLSFVAFTPIVEPLVLEPPKENLASGVAMTPIWLILWGPDDTERGVTKLRPAAVPGPGAIIFPARVTLDEADLFWADDDDLPFVADTDGLGSLEEHGTTAPVEDFLPIGAAAFE